MDEQKPWEQTKLNQLVLSHNFPFCHTDIVRLIHEKFRLEISVKQMILHFFVSKSLYCIYSVLQLHFIFSVTFFVIFKWHYTQFSQLTQQLHSGKSGISQILRYLEKIID